MGREDEDTSMYLRLILLLIDVATDILRRVFKHYALQTGEAPRHSSEAVPRINEDVHEESADIHQTSEDECQTSEDACRADGKVKAFLSSYETRTKLNNLKRKKILNDVHFYLVTADNPKIEKFDISLLITLLCNLFDGTIEPPEKGWENNKPAPQDLTLGADLIRLRNYRNKIVGHSVCTRISVHQFREYWDDLESIFIRICKNICPSEEANIVEKVRALKRKNLGHLTEERCKEAIQDIRKKCEDIVKLQEQVEKLILQTEEFKRFFEKRPGPYSSYIRLLFEGGQLVLSAILRRECSRHEQDINVLVQQNMEAMREELGAGDDLQSLQFTNPEKWDILHISTFIMLLFKDTLNSKEKKHIRTLLDARKEYANIALESLDEVSISNRYVALVQSLSYLSHELGEMIEDECEKCIEANRVGKERSSHEEYFEHLKEHGVGIRTVSEFYKDTISELKEAIKKMEDEDIGFISQPAFELQIITHGTNKMKMKFAEQKVEAVWRAALEGTENSDGFDDLRQIVGKTLEDIRNLGIRGERDDASTSKDLTFPIVIDSAKEIRQICDVLEANSTKTGLQTLAKMLSETLDDNISFKLVVVGPKSLSEIFSLPEETCSREGASVKPLPIDPRQLSSEDRTKSKDNGEVGGTDIKKKPSVLGPPIETMSVQLSTSEAEVPLVEENKEETQLSLNIDNETMLTCTKAFSQMSVTDKRTIVYADFCYRNIQYDMDELARLQRDFLKQPNKKALNEIHLLVNKVCSLLRGKYKNANYIWLAYRANKERQCDIQLFLMIEIQDNFILPKEDFPDKTFEVCVYQVDEIIFEEEKIQNLRETVDELSYQDSIKMRTSINKHADGLLASHKHLTMIEPSGVRLRHSTYITEKCISLYVRKKGYIPLGETPFESRIEEYLTDVREGIAYQAMQNEGVATLKMGCRIARLENPRQRATKFGTLGGFIDHPEYGICGLTAAHVLLEDTEMCELMEIGEITWLHIPSTVEVYFCDGNNINRKIGHFVKAVYEKGNGGNYGFEVAIFQIGNSFRTAGEFREAGHGDDDVQDFFNTGKVFSPINCSRKLKFLKYGAVTGKTTGTFINCMPSCTVRMLARRRIQHPNLNSIILYNQIVIEGADKRLFGYFGDSGSLVMVPGEHGETLCVGILEGMSDDYKTCVSPIGAVLAKLNVSSFRCFQQDELLTKVRALGGTTESLEQRLKTLGHTTDGLDQRLEHLEQTTTQILNAVNGLNVQNIPHARYCNIL